MRHAVVLDIGSSKVVSMCAARAGQDGLSVFGADIRAYTGYRFGAFVNVKDLQRAIVESLQATQRECGFRLRDVAVSVPAAFSHVYVGTGGVSSDSAPKRITGADVDMLINTSLPKSPPAGYRLIHSTPYSFLLDGVPKQELTPDSVASRVEAMVSHVYVSEQFLSPVQDAISAAGMRAGMCIHAPLATALMLIPEKDRRNPAVLVDVGYTNTDVSVVLSAAVVAQDTLEMGGMQFAGDIAYGLQVTQSVAEQVKRRYVFSMDYQDSTELLRTAEGTKSVQRSNIQYIMEERAKELCCMVYQAMQEMGVDADKEPCLCLTGGGFALMRGSREYFEDLLELRALRDMPWMPRMNSPNYASVYGVMEFVLHTDAEEVPAESGMLRRLKELFVK